MIIDAENRPLVTAILLAVVGLAGFLAMVSLPALFEPLSLQTTDRLFELRARFPSLRPVYDDRVVIVDLDDRSLQQIGSIYLDRDDEARLVRNLGSAGVAAQVHDVIYAASLPGDEGLIAATESAGNAYFGLALGLTDGRGVALPDGALLDRDRWQPRLRGDSSTLLAPSRPIVTFSGLAQVARGLGFLDIRADRDGIYRSTPLLGRDGDRVIPSLALRVVCDYLGVTPDRIDVAPGDAITLHGARAPIDASPREIVIPIDDEGRMLINYVGDWGAMTHYPAASIWEASDDRFAMLDLKDELSGKLALLTWVSTGSGDIGPIPGDPLYPLGGIHANAMHAILTGRFLRKLTPRTTFALVTLPLLLLLYLASLRLRTLPFLAFAAALSFMHAAGAAAAFYGADLIVDIPGPILTLVGGTIVVTAYHFHLESQARAVLRGTLDAYFPPAVVDRILRTSRDLMSSAHKRELSILFSDIKGFTNLTATMEAEDVRRLLNEYFGRMIEIVFRHDGTLDKFIGDGLMVFFNDPLPQPDHALRCVRAAIEMQAAAKELDRAWRARGEMPLAIRIGINTGEAVVGNMGSARRLSYTALGAAVNQAQRLESNAPVGGILISERTNDLLAGAVPTRCRAPIQVKGIETPLVVHEVVLGEDGPQNG